MSTQLGIFTQPEEATAAIHTDGGRDFVAVAGEKDGRPAWVFELDADVPNGHGADLTITFKSGTVLSYHGFLRTSPAEFVPDVYREPIVPFVAELPAVVADGQFYRLATGEIGRAHV